MLVTLIKLLTILLCFNSVVLLNNNITATFMKNPNSTTNSTIYICGGSSDDSTGYLSNCYQYNQQTGVWLTIKSMSTPRYEYRLVSNKNQLYAIGGYGGTKYLNTVETYNQQTNQWQSLASLRITRSNIGAALINDTIYVCGGENEISLKDRLLKSCEYYSANIMDNWYLTQQMLTERESLELVAHSDGYLYAIGGYSNTGTESTMDRYDTQTRQWTQMAPMQSSRYNFGSVSFMGKIYVCGGDGSSDGKACESYDPKTNQWTKIASMNRPRFQFKLIVFDDLLYAMGGTPVTDSVEIYDEKADQWYYSMQLPIKLYGFGGRGSLIVICVDDALYTTNCYQLDNQQRKWQSIESLTTQRANFGFVSSKNQLYAIGGWNVNRFGILDDVEQYNYQTKTWKSIASLNNPNNYLAAAVLNDTIYVCGGGNDRILKDCEYYSTVIMDKWHIATPMSIKRFGLELVAHSDGYLYAIGGRVDNTGVESSMERYDPKTKQWTQVANMKSSRYTFGSASYMDKIYVCGGSGNSDSSECEAYDPITNQWRKIAPMNTKRNNFKLLVFNNLIYAMGGYPGIDTVEIYDVKSDKWYYTQSMPVKGYGFGATVITTTTT
ncbi:kelch-like protein 3 [Oppia nitens]|uniref:kelch-like protein 3 n=1 Tax=Oppia nitens TaxID=1686743 RepID=UPI0023DB3645|nr:kelch-like protein 3 [Oppia nitens]